jgi:quercetin dioxygenase-like cupin family protein
VADGRVFLREIVSTRYSLGAFRRMQRDAPRVRGAEVIVDGTVGHTSSGADSTARWRLGPGDEPFLTQTLQVHINEIQPGKSNRGHGHQNEAAFYILQGNGHEVHDGKRYEWSAGDLVVVHTDSVHQHFNDGKDLARILVIKAKSLWMYLGLVQQGRFTEWEDSADFGPRQDWTRLWTAGVESMSKVVRSADRPWTETADGSVRVLASAEIQDLRLFSVDLYEQRIGPGAASGRHWHMADEVVYVLEGSGHSLHWEVEAEIDDRYYARVKRQPSRHEIGPGDILYVPPNTVHQHVASADGPLRILCAHNRVFSKLGYDSVAYLEEEG